MISMRERLSALSVAVALLAMPCITRASLRLQGLGPNLAGITDDPATDITRYPQLNALTSRWLAGSELLLHWCYYAYVCSPGPVSYAVALDARLLNPSATHLYPSAVAAVSKGRWAFAAELTAKRLQGPPSAPWGWTPRDSIWQFAETDWWDVGSGNLGVRWAGPDVALDGTLGASLEKGVYWKGAPPDTFVKTGDFSVADFTPAIRLTLGRGAVRWRCVAAYNHTLRRGVPSYYQLASGRMFFTAVGLNFSPGNGLLIATALQTRVSPEPHNWSWRLGLPTGLEWSQGPLTLRLGVQLSADVTTSEGAEAHFSRETYLGFGIRPMRRLSIDFVPSLDDAANLGAWQLGATAEF